MSKDKGGKNQKKAPDPTGHHKGPSDYQASKMSGAKNEPLPPTNKKK
jgi:hypothetical protein